MQRIFKRGRVWYGWFYEDGRRVVRTTRCRDRAAAERVARQWELDAADPDHAAARTATLTDALQFLFARDEEEVQAGRRSPDTVAFHRSKAGHLVRLFETPDGGGHVPFPLVRLRAANVDGYVSQRRAEKVTDATIAKELVVLRKSLRLAVRAGLWKGRVEEVIPVAFSAGYEPRTRALTAGEVGKLLHELLADRAARVAFIVATSACWRESELARREDVGEGLATVLLRGTKRKTRFRTVPIVSPASARSSSTPSSTRRERAARSSASGATRGATSSRPASGPASSAAARTTSGAPSRAGRWRRACRSTPSRRPWGTRTRGCWSGSTGARPPSSSPRSWRARWV